MLAVWGSHLCPPKGDSRAAETARVAIMSRAYVNAFRTQQTRRHRTVHRPRATRKYQDVATGYHNPSKTEMSFDPETPLFGKHRD